MRGNHDTSDLYPFKVQEVKANLPVSSGGFAVQNVARQELVDDKLFPTFAEAQGHAYAVREAARG